MALKGVAQREININLVTISLFVYYANLKIEEYKYTIELLGIIKLSNYTHYLFWPFHKFVYTMMLK